MEKEKKDIQARNFCFILYPDSMPEDAIGMLLNEKYAIAISPLHQPEPKGEEEERKKPHYHVEISYSGKRKIEEVENYFRPKYNGTKIKKVGDRNVYTRYMLHLDNPDKEQFEINDIMSNYDIRPYIAKEVYVIDIIKWIKVRRIKDFTILVDTLVEEEKFSELEKVSSKATFFKNYLDRFLPKKNNEQ